jgi:hypothetical protein
VNAVFSLVEKLVALIHVRSTGGFAKVCISTTAAHMRRLSLRKGEGGEGYHYCPSGVVTSVPAGGLNSNVEAGIDARV